MSRNLLYTVQRVCEKLDLDNINSINDSQDAILIAREAETTFYDMLSRHDWPEREDLIEINSASSVSNPTKLRLPDNLLELKSIMYDVSEYGSTKINLREIKKISVEEFLRISNTRNSDDANVMTVQYNNTPLLIQTNKAPEYYTTFDNEHIIMDSYDVSVEATLQGNKTSAVAVVIPTFNIADDFIIPLDAVTYPLFLAELTSTMSVYLNGTQSVEDERRRARGISRLRRKAARTQQESLHNNYGRKGDGRS